MKSEYYEGVALGQQRFLLVSPLKFLQILLIMINGYLYSRYFNINLNKPDNL